MIYIVEKEHDKPATAWAAETELDARHALATTLDIDTQRLLPLTKLLRVNRLRLQQMRIFYGRQQAVEALDDPRIWADQSMYKALYAIIYEER